VKRFNLCIKAVDTGLWILGEAAYLLYRWLGWRNTAKMGRLLGRTLYRIDKTGKKLLEKELRWMLPDEAKQARIIRTSKRCFENHYARLLETCFFGRLSKEKLGEMIRVRGLEYISEAMSNGHGAIILLAHFGSFLLPLPYLGYAGYPVNQLTGKQRHRSVIDERIWVWRKRDADRLPIKYIQAEEFLRPMLNALRNNEILSIAFDGRDGANWTTVDFLGRKAQFSSGPFRLARKTGAVIIPTFVVRNDDDTHSIIFERPFDLSQEGFSDVKKAAESDTKKYAEFFSDYVKRYPCHFGMTLVKHHHHEGEDYPKLLVDETGSDETATDAFRCPPRH